MIAGTTPAVTSDTTAVEDRLAADPAIRRQWAEVTTRLALVFADPAKAVGSENFKALFETSSARAAALERLARQPEAFGSLRGRVGLLARGAEREARRMAEANLPALRRDLERYFVLRDAAERRLREESEAARRRLAVDIPALSAAALAVLERVRDALDRNDLPAALAHALADRETKAEIDGLARAIDARFGERSLLGLAAREPTGAVFEKAATGMAANERRILGDAWPLLRAAQRLTAHERAAAALRQAEALRLGARERQGLQ